MNTECIAIDPGSERSGVVTFEWPCDGWPYLVRPVSCELIDNEALYRTLQLRDYSRAVVECIKALYGTSGATHVETIRWEGVFRQAISDRNGPSAFVPVTRSTARSNIGASKGGDTACRRAIIDLYGGDDKAIGGKRCKRCAGRGWRGRDREQCTACAGVGTQSPKGPLYGWKGTHGFAALAVALAFADSVLTGDQRKGVVVADEWTTIQY